MTKKHKTGHWTIVSRAAVQQFAADKGLSPKAIGVLTGRSAVTVRTWLNGSRVPGLASQRALKDLIENGKVAVTAEFNATAFKVARLGSRLSRAGAATVVGVTAHTIKTWEEGWASPRAANLEAAIRFYTPEPEGPEPEPEPEPEEPEAECHEDSGDGAPEPSPLSPHRLWPGPQLVLRPAATRDSSGAVAQIVAAYLGAAGGLGSETLTPKEVVGLTRDLKQVFEGAP